LRSPKVPRELRDAIASAPDAERARTLRERFATHVPTGLVLDGEHASPALAKLTPGELIMIRRALLAEVHEAKTVPRSAPWQAAVYAPGGAPSLVFVWPAHTAHAGEFRRSVVHASWRDSLPSDVSTDEGGPCSAR
jgi:hypothetical protein